MSKNASVAGGGVATAGERVWTWPLAVFLLGVAAILLFAARERFATPAMGEAILRLADGDADGEERNRLLRGVVAAALRSDDPRDRWAGLLAAVPLGDRASHTALQALPGPGQVPATLPQAGDLDLLHLGDPMLGNLLRAMIAEQEGDRQEALRRWRQVQAQSRLNGSPFAAELAAAAVQRLPH